MSRTRRQGLDDLDRRILRALERNGRRSNVDLAKEFDVSERTIRARIARLQEVVGLSIYAEYRRLSPAVEMVYVLTARPEARGDVASQISTHPATLAAWVTNGSSDIIVRAVFEDEPAAIRFQADLFDMPGRVSAVSSSRVVARYVDGAISSGRSADISSELLANALLATHEDQGFDEYADWFTATLADVFGADHTMLSLYRVDESGVREIFYHLNGLSEAYMQAAMRRIVGPGRWGVIRRAAATGEHIFVPDAESSPLLREIADLIRAAGYKSVLSMPIRLDSGLLGVATLYYDVSVSLDEAYFSTLQAFMDKAAPTLRRYAHELT